MLLYLKPILQELVDNANANTATNNTPPNQVNFVRAGENKPPTKTKSSKSTFLSGATHWRLLVELGGNKIVYPPEIYSTIQRPDIGIWSKQTKRVMNVELTCPAEEGIQAAQTRKSDRYDPLTNAARERGWTAESVTIEAGARGFVARTVPLSETFGSMQKEDQLGLQNRLQHHSTMHVYNLPCTCT